MRVDSLQSAAPKEMAGGVPLVDFYAEFDGVFSEMVNSNVPLSRLMDPGFTYVTSALAKKYALDVDASAGPKRVTASDRGSFLQMGAFHYLSGGSATGTSPIGRGLQVLRTLLCDPIQGLSNDLRKANDAISNQLLADANPPKNLIEHWKRIETQSPNCMACHARINPMGFPLENYAFDGAWRDTYGNGSAIAYSGTFQGKAVTTPQNLIDGVVGSPEFYACAYRAGFSYLIGQPLDRPKLTSAVSASTVSSAGIRDVLLDIVSSDAFLNDGAG